MQTRFALVLGAIGLATLSVASPQTYAQISQPIRAGVVVLDADRVGNSYPQSTAPFAFLNLNSDSKYRPKAWNLYNPSAPGVVTADIQARWASINASNGFAAPALGERITKRNAAYWEVFLSTVTEDTLANYDVLLVAPSVRASLSPRERDTLRKFVDRGGVLWIDPSKLAPGDSGIDQVNSFPLPFSMQSGSGGNLQNDRTQPLISSPISLNSNELQLVNNPIVPYANQVIQDQDLSAVASIAGYYTGLLGQFQKFQPVCLLGSDMTLAVGRMGDGFIVVTGRGAARKLNGNIQLAAPTDLNTFYYATDPPANSEALASAKLAVNIISLASEFRQPSGGSRKTNSSAVDIGAPLMRRFQSQGALALTSQNVPPVLYKGVIVMAKDDHLEVYDADPAKDLDGDGDPDDGIGGAISGIIDSARDYSLGQGQDLVWSSQTLQGPISAPVCVEVPDDKGGFLDQVLVIDHNGNLHVFDLFKKNSEGRLVSSAVDHQIYNLSPPNGNASYSGSPNPPTVQEGAAYIADTISKNGTTQGRVWVVSLKNHDYVKSAGSYVLNGGTSDVQLPQFSSAPTVGYIPILDNSGGVDKVLYGPLVGVPNGGSAASAGVISLWVGVRGERPIRADLAADLKSLTLITRASQTGGLPIDFNSIRLSVLDSFGNPLTGAQMASTFDGAPVDGGAGSLVFTVKNSALLGATPNVRIDYNLDWGSALQGVLPSLERGTLRFPDNVSGSNSRQILGSIALSPRGMIYAVVSAGTSGSGGSFFTVREEGRGSFKCVSRWDLFDKHTVALSQAPSVSYREVLADRDPVNVFVSGGSAQGPLTKFTFAGGPAVRNDKVFVTATATKAVTFGAFTVPLPVSIMLCFRAEPPVVELNVGTFPDGSAILQPDFARSAQGNELSVLQGPSVNYDKDRGILRIENLMNVTRGPVQSCLSTSQPVIIRRPSSPDTLYEPDTNGSRWNPLLWYSVAQGVSPLVGTGASTNGPVVTGNTVFATGTSAIIDILKNGITGIPKQTGVIYALDTSVSATDPFLQTDYEPGSTFGGPNPPPVRPWMKQLWALKGVTSGQITADVHHKWPQNIGITGGSDWAVRLNQTAMPGSTMTYGLVAGNGTLAAWGDGGLYAFSKADFVVCDEGRLARFDSSGNPIFTTSAVLSAGINSSGGTGSIRSLIRPSRAYPIEGGQTLVADPGANRIVRMDDSGVENRSLSEFILDPTYIPSGYIPGASQSLSGPQDVATYGNYVRLGTQPLVTNQQAVEYWTHYLVADTGNHRLVELIDRFLVDSSGHVGDAITLTEGTQNVSQLGVLLWASPANLSGKDYGYNSINRVYLPASGSAGGRFVYVAGIGNASPTRFDNGLDAATAIPTIRENRAGGGGVVVFDPLNPNDAAVFNSVSIPDTSGTSYWDETTNTFQVATDPLLVARRKSQTHNFNGVKSVTSRILLNSGTPALSVMVCDSSGVFEGTYNIGATATATLSGSWMVTNEAYRVVRHRFLGAPSLDNVELRPTFAKRLDNGDVLITNGFSGQNRGNKDTTTNTFFGRAPFRGEVVEISGDAYNPLATNLGFDASSIVFQLPPIQGARGLISPVFADRR